MDIGGDDDDDDDDGVFRLANKLLVLVHSKIVQGDDVDDDVFFFRQMENLIDIDNRNLILNDDVIFFHTFIKWYDISNDVFLLKIFWKILSFNFLTD